MYASCNQRVVLFLYFAFITKASPAVEVLGHPLSNTNTIPAYTTANTATPSSAWSTSSARRSNPASSPASSSPPLYDPVGPSLSQPSSSKPINLPNLIDDVVVHPDNTRAGSPPVTGVADPVSQSSNLASISLNPDHFVAPKIEALAAAGPLGLNPASPASIPSFTTGSGSADPPITTNDASLRSGTRVFPTLTNPTIVPDKQILIGSNGLKELMKADSPTHAPGFVPASYVGGSFIPGHYISGAPTSAPITNLPPPVSIENGQPIYAANASLPPDYASGALKLAYGGGTCSMSPGVDGYNAKSCSCWNSVAKWFNDYATATITSQTCQSTYDIGVITEAQTLGCRDETSTALAKPYSVPQDCCNKCDIRGSAVQLIYWPDSGGPATINLGSSQNSAEVTKAGDPSSQITPAPQQRKRRAAAEPSGEVSDGFTFISPSVYVAYSGISARASCVALTASWRSIGDLYTVTRAYDPAALSTARCVAPGSEGMGIAFYFNGPGPPGYFQGIFNGWEQVDYAGLMNPPSPEQLVERYQSCFPDHTEPLGAAFAQGLYTAPQLSFPADVTDIDPEWETWGMGTCTPIALGIYDPPRALNKATALAGDPGGEQPVTAVEQLVVQPSQGPAPVPALVNPVGAKITGAFNAGVEGSNEDHKPAQVLAPAVNKDPVVVDPGVVSKPQAVNPPPQNLEVNQNAAVTPGSTVENTVVDPNSEDPQQMAALHQALAPAAPNPQPGPQPQPAPQEANVVNNPPVVNADTVPITLTPVQPSEKPQPVLGVGQEEAAVVNEPAVNNAPANNPPGNKAPVAPANVNPPAAAAVVNKPAVNDAPVNKPPANNPPVAPANINPPAAAAVVKTVPSNNGAPIPGAVAGAVVAPAAVPPIKKQPIVQNPNSDLVIAGTPLPPGAQTTADGYTISNGGSHVVVDGSTQALPPIAPAPTPPPVANNQVVQVSNGHLQVAGQNIAPGSQVTASGHVIDYANPSNVVIDGTSHMLTPISTSNPLVIGDQSLQRAPSGGLVVAGSTMAPGAQAEVSGHSYSVGAAAASNVVVDGNTYSLPPTNNAFLLQTLPPSNAAPVPTGPMTLGNGLVVTPQITPAPGSNSVVNQVYDLPNGAAISAGGPPAVVSGTTYSALPSNKGFLLNGASTLPLPPSFPTAPPPPANSIFTLGNQVITAAPTGFIVAPGTTLSPGGPAVTISGTPLSLLPSGTALIIGTSTLPLPTPTVYTVGSLIFTASPTGFVIAPGTTLVPNGAAATISGTAVSLGPSGTLVVGSNTLTLPSQSVFTLGDGEVFTAAPTGFVLGGGQTVRPGGGAVTEGTEVVSLGTNSVLKIGTTMATLGAGTPAASSSAVVSAFQPGSGAGGRKELLAGVVGAGVGVVGGVVAWVV